MQRRIMQKLIEWKNTANHMPLIIRGARQVGKTWLMKEFGKIHYKKVAYISFDSNERMENLFKSDLNPERIITGLQAEVGFAIDAEDTLIIFDEIQEVPRALTSLKYFCENAPQYNIIAAGSLLGVALHHGTSFPVGKVSFVDLYPLDFPEFMDALGKGNYIELLQNQDFDTITAFKSTYIDLLRQYYYIGGMPGAVVTFLNTNDYAKVREEQKRLLETYEQDFSKHAPNEVVPRIRMLWDSIPAQLARENRKFVYGLIRQGARAREYELAMQWLIDCGLLLKVNRVAKPDMPLAAYQDFNAFKLYVLDVGILGAMADLDVKALLGDLKIFEEFKGATTEQFVAQQLFAGGFTPYYWSSDKGQAEVDFLLQSGSDIIPIEVKASENLQAKSLKSYVQKYSPKIALRTSLSDYRRESWLINLPLYAINELHQTANKDVES